MSIPVRILVHSLCIICTALLHRYVILFYCYAMPTVFLPSLFSISGVPENRVEFGGAGMFPQLSIGGNK